MVTASSARRLLVALLLGVGAGCQLPSDVLYGCGPAGECGADQRCWPDGYCHPLADGEPPADAGNDAGRDAGGADAGVDAGAPDSGVDAGDDAGFDAGDDAGADAGDDAGFDGGVDAGPCVAATACPPSAQCGAFDAGCGLTLECGECFAPEECGTVTANQCGLPKLCLQGFCWENPLPQGNTLNAAFAFGPKAVWAVGEVGTVLFWNGEKSALVDLGTNADLFAVWGSSPDDLYVAGDEGTIFHFNGATWVREVPPGTYRINTLWVSPTGVAFAGANGGPILKRSPAGMWTAMTLNPSNTSDVLAMTGLDTGEVYATTTTRVYRLPTLSSNMWLGENPWAGNPNTRETMAMAALGPQLYAGWKVTNQSFGQLFERQSDAGWRQYGPNIPGGVGALTVTLAGPWVATLSGLVTRVGPDGGLSPTGTSRDAGLRAITPITIDSVFAGGELGTMEVVSDAGARELFFGGTTTARGVCGFGETMTFPSQAYAPAEQRVVYDRVAMGDRARWDPVVRMASSQDWHACFADQPNRVFIVGNQREYLRQSMGVFVTDDFVNDNDWFGAWGAPGGPYWFVNDGNTVYTSATGAAATFNASIAASPRGIWGVASTDIVAVGATGGLTRYNGTWANVSPLPQANRQLRAVHAQAFSDGGSLYSIVGTGTAWRRFPDGGFVADFIDAGHRLTGTYVMPAGDIWAAGDDGGTTQGRGVLWHFEPTTQLWSPMPVPSTRAFNAMGGFGDTGPFIVGTGGAILRHLSPDGG